MKLPRLLACGVALLAFACLPDPTLAPQGNAAPLVERGHAEVTTHLVPCQPTIVNATAAMSLKSPDPERLRHLVLGPTPAVRWKGVSMRVLEIAAQPAMVTYNDKTRLGARIDCRVELTAASDAPSYHYDLSLSLPRADDLSYWGGYSTPTFTFMGEIARTHDKHACPLGEMPAPAAPPPPPEVGVVGDSWRTIRWLTKGESLAAALLLPLAAVGAYLASDRVPGPVRRLIFFLSSLLFGLCAAFAWARLLFIWP